MIAYVKFADRIASRAGERHVGTFLPLRKESGTVSVALSLRNMRDRIPEPLQKILPRIAVNDNNCPADLNMVSRRGNFSFDGWQVE